MCRPMRTTHGAVCVFSLLELLRLLVEAYKWIIAPLLSGLLHTRVRVWRGWVFGTLVLCCVAYMLQGPYCCCSPCGMFGNASFGSGKLTPVHVIHCTLLRFLFSRS